VFELPSGREITRFNTTAADPKPNQPRQLSAMGRFLLDDDRATVWDVDSGNRLLRVNEIGSGNTLFTPDGQSVVTLAAAQSEIRLAYFDIATGTELVDRRVLIMDYAPAPGPPMINLNPKLLSANGDGNWLAIRGFQKFTPLLPNSPWVSNVPILRGLVRYSRTHAFVVVETSTGREIARGGSGANRVTADGRYVVSCSEGPDWLFQIWDVPARRPFWWLVEGISLWTLALACFRWLILFFQEAPAQGRTYGIGKPTTFTGSRRDERLNPTPPV
jgi:hypothetical protein